MSYSHAADGQFAPALRNGLQRFATPWGPFRLINPVRSLRVFQDTASLSADPALWSRIEQALTTSEWFILVASPDAANSPWVARELDFWCQHKSLERLLIVLTSGEIVWNPKTGDFDWRESNAISRRLSGVFREEPRWVDARFADAGPQATLRDPRFRDLVAELAAPLRGVPKDDLIGEDIHQHHRLNRWRNAALCTLLLLLGVALWQWYIADTRLKRANSALADGLWSDINLGSVLKPREIRALWTLAVADPSVRDIFVEKALLQPENLVRFGQRPELIARALGLGSPSPAKAARIVSAATTFMERGVDDSAGLALSAVIRALAPKLNEAQADAALAQVLPQKKMEDYKVRTAKNQAVQALAPKLSEMNAEAALAQLLLRMEQPQPPSYDNGLESAAHALVSKLNGSQALATLARALKRIGQADPRAVASLGKVVRALAPKLDDGGARAGAASNRTDDRF
jgi:hypothetical protein